VTIIDRSRFEQILTNLLSNASKYSAQGSVIEVGAQVINSEIVIEVSDQGPGIPVEEQKLIFEAYYRGKNISGGGIGIGLAIVKSLVELHGGRIWVSDRDGGGSVFSFSVPLERKDVS
jgi:two-component system sensor histidine kinase KdpD